MKGKRTYIVGAAVVVIAVMLYSALSAPGVKDLAGNFKEVAFVRNEQNSGPVIRVYAVTSVGEKWSEMEQYGSYMPHTKYGITRIYFFSDSANVPQVLDFDSLEEKYQKDCIAIYEKDGMSQVSFRRYPYAK